MDSLMVLWHNYVDNSYIGTPSIYLDPNYPTSYEMVSYVGEPYEDWAVSNVSSSNWIYSEYSQPYFPMYDIAFRSPSLRSRPCYIWAWSLPNFTQIFGSLFMFSNLYVANWWYKDMSVHCLIFSFWFGSLLMLQTTKA